MAYSVNILPRSFTSELVEVGVAWTTLIAVHGTSRYSRLNIEVTSDDASSAALSGMKIQFRSNAAAAWQDYIGDDDFANRNNTNIVFVSSVTPHTLAAGATANASVRIQGFAAVHLLGRVATNTANVIIRGEVA